MFFPSSSYNATTTTVGRISIRHCSTKGSASQLLRFEPTSSQNRLQSGFTLIELLVVILLLAIVSGAAVMSYDGVQDQGRYDTTKFEMAEIKKALLQFRRDSGSKSFPGQGIYDCTNFSNGGSVNDPNSTFPLTFSASVAVPSPMSKAEFIAWCQAEDNFWMLFIDPLERGSADSWNEDTHRGWHGPYLQNKGNPLSTSSIDTIPTVTTPYDDNNITSVYFLVDLSTASASIVSLGENNTSGAITDCRSDDPDDYVLCLLR